MISSLEKLQLGCQKIAAISLKLNDIARRGGSIIVSTIQGKPKPRRGDIIERDKAFVRDIGNKRNTDCMDEMDFLGIKVEPQRHSGTEEHRGVATKATRLKIALRLIMAG